MAGTKLKNRVGTVATLREDLTVWDGENGKLGWVQMNGDVHNMEHRVGRVDESNGYVYDYKNSHVGTINPKTGFVQDYKLKTVGDVDGPHIMLGGAALLLLVL